MTADLLAPVVRLWDEPDLWAALWDPSLEFRLAVGRELIRRADARSFGDVVRVVEGAVG